MSGLDPTGYPYSRVGASVDVDLAIVAQRLADRVRGVPGVVGGLRISTGSFRWSGEPTVQLHQEDGRVVAAVAIGVRSRRTAAWTAESVRAYIRDALEAEQLEVGALHVQVALVDW